MENETLSIQRLIKHKENLKDKSMIPFIGTRQNGEPFSDEIQNIEKSAFVYRNEIYTFLNKNDTNKNILNLGGGNPLNYKPFPLISKAIKKISNDGNLYLYPLSQGEEKFKHNVIDYLRSLNICANKNSLNCDNILFTQSTTHAFSLILKLIVRPYDVVLFTAPTYGLFTYTPERVGGLTKFLELSAEDNWLPNPNKLNKRISDINNELKKTYTNLDYTPRVVAFVNINPHNPLGTVISSDDNELLRNLNEVCFKNGVFVIDDLVYYDLSYNKKPLPCSSFREYFDNTISMFGLSKSYGVAGARAGIIVANETIIRGIRDQIFHDMDSISIIQASAISSTFSTTKKRNYSYKKYFSKTLNMYQHKLNILKTFVYGIDSIENKIERNKILYQLKKYKVQKELYNNKLGLKLEINPESGFFALINLNCIKNKSYKNNIILTAEDYLRFVFKNTQIKFLTGASFAWPNKNDIVVRITYSCLDKDLIYMLAKLIEITQKLK